MENFKGDFMDETFTVTDDGRLVCYVAVEFHFYTKFVTSFVRFVLTFGGGFAFEYQSIQPQSTLYKPVKKSTWRLLIQSLDGKIPD